MPVSYTHLDVYKRQPILQPVIEYVFEVELIIIVLSLIPVSYTHLDVYKRQLIALPSRVFLIKKLNKNINKMVIKITSNL